MRINWIGYYHDYDGYGRFNSRMVKALQGIGADVHFLTRDHITMPKWMQEREGIDWSGLTISCLPAINCFDVPGRHWLLTMIESNVLDYKWLHHLATLSLEKVLVPCRENQHTFQAAGIPFPVEIFRGGTDPLEFPVVDRKSVYKRPYTFLTLADRGFRKGWEEVWKAFYIAFGGKTTGIMDAKLIIKYIPKEIVSDHLTKMSYAEGSDSRITYIGEKLHDPYLVYDMADCIVIPSYFEGWGMPHREAAMMGLPVITTKYSGLDDGFTEEWALIVPHREQELGWWVEPEIEPLAQMMKWAYYSPETALGFGRKAATWLRENQTWEHAARNLIEKIGADDADRLVSSRSRELLRI